MLKRQLTNRHYAVTVTSNGKEALDTLLTTKFDVILMDLEMVLSSKPCCYPIAYATSFFKPVMGGLEAIRILRSREAAAGATPYVRLSRTKIAAATKPLRAPGRDRRYR